MPAALPIEEVSGLDNSYAATSSLASPVELGTPTPGFRVGGYWPSDFRTAYGVGGGATGQTVGLVLWGAPLKQSDLDSFASQTHSLADRDR